MSNPTKVATVPSILFASISGQKSPLGVIGDDGGPEEDTTKQQEALKNERQVLERVFARYGLKI